MGLGELRIDPLQVIFLALIQGITEFLPISSSGHLILAARAMGWEDQGLSFDIAVHGGSLTALALYFRRELAGFGASVTRLSWDPNTELLAKVAVAAAPIALAGWLIQPYVETALRDVGVVAAAIIGFAIALWWADRRRGTGGLASVTFAQAALIGVAQTAALIPGASRAGVTITAALLLGLSRQGAARFSFLLAMPTIAGALLLAALDPATWQAEAWPSLALGFAIAGVSAYACIAAFVALVNRTGMTPYVLYRLALGLALLTLW